MAKSNKAKPAAKAAKSAKPAAKVTTEVEIVEESKPAGMEAGVAIVTTVALIAAILVVDYGLAGYGAGMFFK